MSTESMIVTLFVTAMFVAFSLILAWATARAGEAFPDARRDAPADDARRYSGVGNVSGTAALQH